MKRASLFIMLSGSMLLAQLQTPVEITAEPHHRLLLENDSVRAFAVTIPPREATELTRHEHNFLVVTFQDSEIASWAEGEAGVLTYRFRANDIHFYFGGRARAMRNDTSSEYRNVTVEFLNPKVTTYGYQSNTRRWQYGGNTLLPPQSESNLLSHHERSEGSAVEALQRNCRFLVAIAPRNDNSSNRVIVLGEHKDR